jgi:hypothetical protein
VTGRKPASFDSHLKGSIHVAPGVHPTDAGAVRVTAQVPVVVTSSNARLADVAVFVEPWLP